MRGAELLPEIFAVGKDLELLLYKLRDVPHGSVDREIYDHLDCAIRDVARAQSKADPGRLPLDPNRPYLPGVNQCPNCNVGGCQGCDGNGR